MSADLARRHCRPCDRHAAPLPADRIRDLAAQLPGWTVTPDGRRLRREWRVKDFAAGLNFFHRIGAVAETEDHHPDLHLTNYRDAAVELWTHAAGGLTDNDFILAAKIDGLPVELKT